jgi:hypothetical protein
MLHDNDALPCAGCRTFVHARRSADGALIISNAEGGALHLCPAHASASRHGVTRRGQGRPSEGTVSKAGDTKDPRAARTQDSSAQNVSEQRRRSALSRLSALKAHEKKRIRSEEECTALLQRPRVRWVSTGPETAECADCHAPLVVIFDTKKWTTDIRDQGRNGHHSCSEYRRRVTANREAPAKRSKAARFSSALWRPIRLRSNPNECNSCGNLLAGRGEERICFHCGS